MEVGYGKRVAADVVGDEVFQKVNLGGLGFADQSVTSLSAAQAAGTDPVLPVNVNRKALKIVPPSDCTLKIGTSGAGIPLFGGVPNEFSGGDCPTNALYITGLSTGVAVTIWEA